jgi:hypothetical protein
MTGLRYCAPKYNYYWRASDSYMLFHISYCSILHLMHFLHGTLTFYGSVLKSEARRATGETRITIFAVFFEAGKEQISGQYREPGRIVSGRLCPLGRRLERLMMEAVRMSETSAFFDDTARHYISERCYLHVQPLNLQRFIPSPYIYISYTNLAVISFHTHVINAQIKTYARLLIPNYL